MHLLDDKVFNYPDLYLSFVFYNLVFKPIYHCSKFYFLSEQYILYMKGQLNTGVDQTELLLECLQLFQSHVHTLQHNKVIKNSWRIL